MKKLRPYQQECIGAILGQFADVRATMAVLATGLGKTVIFSSLVKRWDAGKVLILAHREELINQAVEEVFHSTGQSPAVEMADQEASHSANLLGEWKTCVASVASICRPERLARFNPAQFGLVVIDECHHSAANTYRTILKHFRQNESLCVLGVTATPKRHDKLAMGQTFDTVAYEYGIEPASKDGWLVSVQQQRVIVEGLDFSKVRQSVNASTGEKDLNEKELEEVLKQEKILHAVAAPTVKIAGERSTLVFCVTIEHSRLMCEVLNRYKPNSAAYVDKDTDKKKERPKLVADFKAGRIQFLVNCGIFLEGFDAPRASLICMARPTNSLALYTQVIGRATRVLPGVIDHLDESTPERRRAAIAASDKPNMLILDFKGNAGKHKIVQADDLLGGKYAAPVKHYARETAEQEGRAVDVEESLDRAEAELALLEEERELAAKRAKIKAEAEYRTQHVGLFSGSAAKRKTDNTEGKQFKGELATEKQVNYLMFLGVPRSTAKGYSKGQAGAVIDSIVSKRKGAS